MGMGFTVLFFFLFLNDITYNTDVCGRSTLVLLIKATTWLTSDLYIHLKNFFCLFCFALLLLLYFNSESRTNEHMTTRNSLD